MFKKNHIQDSFLLKKKVRKKNLRNLKNGKYLITAINLGTNVIYFVCAPLAPRLNWQGVFFISSKNSSEDFVDSKTAVDFSVCLFIINRRRGGCWWLLLGGFCSLSKKNLMLLAKIYINCNRNSFQLVCFFDLNKEI